VPFCPFRWTYTWVCGIHHHAGDAPARTPSGSQAYWKPLPALRPDCESLFEARAGCCRFPRVQILTIAELLHGKQAQYPRYAPTATFRQASRREKAADPQQALL